MKTKSAKWLWLMATVALAAVALAANRPRTEVCVDCNPVPTSLPADVLTKGTPSQ